MDDCSTDRIKDVYNLLSTNMDRQVVNISDASSASVSSADNGGRRRTRCVFSVRSAIKLSVGDDCWCSRKTKTDSTGTIPIPVDNIKTKGYREGGLKWSKE